MQRGVRRAIAGVLIASSVSGLILGVSILVRDSTPAAERRDLAHSLLCSQHPAEARSQLRLVLSRGPDAEASWLLSRALLQQGFLSEALAALKEAGSFADEQPMRTDPAPYVGAARVGRAMQKNTRPSKTPATPGPFIAPPSLATWGCPPQRWPTRLIPGSVIGSSGLEPISSKRHKRRESSTAPWLITHLARAIAARPWSAMIRKVATSSSGYRFTWKALRRRRGT